MPPIKVELLPHQLKFVSDVQTRYLAMVSGYGAGKTKALICKTIDLAALNAGTSGGLFSATHELATDILIPEMDEHLEAFKIRHTYKASPHPRYILKFPHGSTEVLVKSFENWKRIVGHNYSFATVDEVDTVEPAIAKKAWNKLLGRIRVGNVCQIATTTTPEGFRFVYQFWVKEAKDENGNPKRDRRIIHARSTDNPFLDPGFIPSLLENYSEELVKAYVNGQFVNLQSGLVYPNFDRRLNDCQDVVEEHDHLHIGMDFNVQKQCAIVHVLRSGLPRAVSEFINRLDTPDMIAAIKERFPAHSEQGLIQIYPDASGAARKTTNASTSDIALLKQAGFKVIVDPSNPAVKDRINAMNAMFCNAKKERRYLINTSACPNYTESLEQQVYDDNGNPAKPSGENISHSLDAAGYFIAKEFPIQQRVKKPAVTSAARSEYS